MLGMAYVDIWKEIFRLNLVLVSFSLLTVNTVRYDWKRKRS